MPFRYDGFMFAATSGLPLSVRRAAPASRLLPLRYLAANRPGVLDLLFEIPSHNRVKLTSEVASLIDLPLYHEDFFAL